MHDADDLILLELVEEKCGSCGVPALPLLAAEYQPAALVPVLVVEHGPGCVFTALSLQYLAINNGIRGQC